MLLASSAGPETSLLVSTQGIFRCPPAKASPPAPRTSSILRAHQNNSCVRPQWSSKSKVPFFCPRLVLKSKSPHTKAFYDWSETVARCVLRELSTWRCTVFYSHSPPK